MIIRHSRQLMLWLPVVVSIMAMLAATAQEEELEPRWLRLEIPQTSLGLEVEGLAENLNSGGTSSTHDQISLVPVVGLQTSGSIYHPDLISFDLNGEFGWGWLYDSIKSSGSVTTLNESDSLLRYLVQVSVLPDKPYNATFSAAQDHTYQTYDAFNSYTVDSIRDSGRFGWVTTALELNADLGYRDDNSTGINGSSEVIETYFNFYGTQKRQSGQSSLTYRYDAFDNTINFGNRQTSVFNSVGISDSEIFGSRQQINASTSAGFSEAQYSSEQTETVTANENIAVKNGPKLDSYLMFNFSDSRMNPVDLSILQGSAGLHHQLYDSLTSTFDVHGSYDNSSSSSSSATDDLYGLGIREDYTKQLGRIPLPPAHAVAVIVGEDVVEVVVALAVGQQREHGVVARGVLLGVRLGAPHVGERIDEEGEVMAHAPGAVRRRGAASRARPRDHEPSSSGSPKFMRHAPAACSGGVERRTQRVALEVRARC